MKEDWRGRMYHEFILLYFGIYGITPRHFKFIKGNNEKRHEKMQNFYTHTRNARKMTIHLHPRDKTRLRIYQFYEHLYTSSIGTMHWFVWADVLLEQNPNAYTEAAKQNDMLPTPSKINGVSREI